MDKKPCWRISYYFTSGNKKRLLKGVYCGCQPGDSREDAIDRLKSDTIAEMETGCKFVKMAAVKSKPNHYCFVNEES